MAIMKLPDYAGVRASEKSEHRQKLDRILNTMFSRAVATRNRWQVWWFLVMAYLQGVRTVSAIDYDQGLIDVNDADPTDEFCGENDSIVPFRWDSLMAQRQTEIGRLLRLDVSPVVRKKRHALQSLQSAATSQVLLDYLLGGSSHENNVREAITLLVDYGTAGLLHLTDEPSAITSPSGLRYGQEIVPPWELLAFPEVRTVSDLRAIGRLRWFPLRELDRWTGLWAPSDDEYGLLDVQEFPFGESMNGLRSMVDAGGGSAAMASRIFDEYAREWARSRSGTSKSGSTGPFSKEADRDGQCRESEPFVQLRELWIKGSRGSLVRYLAMAGKVVIADRQFEDGEVPMPIVTMCYDDIGQFYGRSFVARNLPGSLRLERLLHRLLTNTGDFSRFGFLMVPMNMQIDAEAFKASGDPRIIMYESDPQSRRDPVQQISPVSSSDLPGKVAMMIEQGLERIARQGPLFQGDSPGRTDSDVGFRTLAQTGSTHLIATAQSIWNAYTGHYRSALYHAVRQIRHSAVPIQVELTRIENSVAGIQIDPQTGGAVIDPGILDVWEVEIGIRSRDPSSADAERTEAYRMFLDRTLKPIEFFILNYRNGWGYPVGNRRLYENYVRAVMYNLRLFNGGQVPGRVDYYPGIFDMPEVHLYATEEFTASLDFDLASDAVKQAFAERILKLRAAQGGLLPSGMPSQDMAAFMSGMSRNTMGGILSGMSGGMSGGISDGISGSISGGISGGMQRNSGDIAGITDIGNVVPNAGGSVSGSSGYGPPAAGDVSNDISQFLTGAVT